MKSLMLILLIAVGLKTIECASLYTYLSVTSAIGENDFPSVRRLSLVNKCDGSNQSPININTTAAQETEIANITFTNFDSEYSYKIENRVYEISVILDNEATVPTISGGGLTGEYKFSHIDVRFGENANEGSDHRINSESGNGEFQYVFIKNDYSTFNDAITSETAGAVAIISVLTEDGADNADLDAFFTTASGLASANLVTSSEVSFPASGKNNFTNFYQLTSVTSQKFWTYSGSYTRPMCEEVVSWIIMENKMVVSEAQYAKLRVIEVQGILTGAKATYSGNFRSAQNLNGRTVSKKKQPTSPTDPKPTQNLFQTFFEITASIVSLPIGFVLTVIDIISGIFSG